MASKRAPRRTGVVKSGNIKNTKRIKAQKHRDTTSPGGPFTPAARRHIEGPFGGRPT